MQAGTGRGAVPLTCSLMNKNARLHLLRLQTGDLGEEGELWLMDVGCELSAQPPSFPCIDQILPVNQSVPITTAIAMPIINFASGYGPGPWLSLLNSSSLTP